MEKETLVLPVDPGPMIVETEKKGKEERKDDIQSVQNQLHWIKHSPPTSTITMSQR